MFKTNKIQVVYKLRRNCILADEMGLGKTIQSITFLQKIFDHGIKVLVKKKYIVVFTNYIINCNSNLLLRITANFFKFSSFKFIPLHFYKNFNSCTLFVDQFNLFL